MTRPLLTQAARPATMLVSATNELGEVVPTLVAGEHPLTVYLDKHELVTLMTLGAAPEALVIGYLRNQRLVEDIADLSAVQVDWEVNSAAVTTRSGAPDLAERMEHRTVTTGCGQGTVFGDMMADLDRIALSETARLSHATLMRLLENVRRHESIYRQAGAVHGCALASAEGDILMFVEDVGRHNAVDAIAGQMWLDGIAGEDKIFYTTGRLTSEMVIKAARMDVPIIVSRSGLTAMGYDLAQKIGMTMIGRAQGKHYLVFSGQQRFTGDAA